MTAIKSGNVPNYHSRTRIYTWKEGHPWHDFVLLPVQFEGPLSTMLKIEMVVSRDMVLVSNELESSRRFHEEIKSEPPLDDRLFGSYDLPNAIMKIQEHVSAIDSINKMKDVGGV